MKSEAMKIVRAGLCERIDRLASLLPRASVPAVRRDLNDIGRTAGDYGMVPLLHIIRGMDRALSDGGWRGQVAARSYVEAMRDAAGCERTDEAAGEAYLASVNLRLAG